MSLIEHFNPEKDSNWEDKAFLVSEELTRKSFGEIEERKKAEKARKAELRKKLKREKNNKKKESGSST